MAQSLFKAFVMSQKVTYQSLREVAALKTMLPWLPAHVEQLEKELSPDWWAYGFQSNRHVLETFLRYHHQQGLSHRLLKPEELFAPETFEAFKI
jgi:4,5-dihydroxyphthalate decarboxylase